jgi:hypothetical protein
MNKTLTGVSAVVADAMIGEAEKQTAVDMRADLIEVLEDLLFAIPGQTNDRDWWPDELTDAVQKAKALLSRYE